MLLTIPPALHAAVEAAVAAIKSVECLELISKLLYNAAVSPREDKFRRVKLSNKRIAETVVATTGALDAMTALGWERVVNEDGAAELVVREGLFISMKEVRIVEAARERLAKEQQRSGSNKNLAAMVQVQA